MSPQEFVEKWSKVTTSERATAQSHFNDLCDLLGEPKPHDADPDGEWYAFEKGAAKTGGGDGWADVWRRGCYAWEYKGKHKDLDRALAQVKQYATALLNPPLLVACDIERIVAVTNWTNTVSVRYEVGLSELLRPERRELVRQIMRGDARLRTGESRQALTAKVAREFAELARELELAGHPPLVAAHFVNRLVFCMFAEDAGLLKDRLFSQLLDAARKAPGEFPDLAGSLFNAMHSGGRVGFQTIEWFNGGLFDADATALPLTRAQLDRVRKAAELDWSAIDPSILGTLFERGLDPAKRSQLGAHYTDPENILRIVEPVVLRPLEREWAAAKTEIDRLRAPARRREVLQRFLDRLRGVRVLDPACGSGNFLYMALRALKDFELRVLLEAEAKGFQREFPQLGPEVVRGIELSPYAAELARVSIWIGELQWQLEHGFNIDRKPILRPLESIENRDALLTLDSGQWVKAEWPEAEFIIGNPPFLGDKKMRSVLGGEYTDLVRQTYEGHVSGGADFVAFWFYRGGKALREGRVQRVGLVATNKIRKGRNNAVLREAVAKHPILAAWDDLAWHDENGAAVRVALVSWGSVHDDVPPLLNGIETLEIYPDLTGRTSNAAVDLGNARKLPERANGSFNGVCLAGEFDVTEKLAREWLVEPNPAGCPNSDVLRPLWNGKDLTDGWRGRWLIDFGTDREQKEATGYAGPFRWVEERVRPVRMTNAERIRREKWWRPGRPRPELRAAVSSLGRVLVTPETAKHRWFRWLDADQIPEHKLVVIATDDDFFQGVLSSRIHRLWAVRKGNWLGVGNDSVYAATSTFATFPFPDPTDAQRAAIADAARELDRLREAWLNPPEWTEDETLVFPATVGGPWHRWIPGAAGLPPGAVAEARYIRCVAKPGARAMVAARTLTKLYNDRPAWLRQAHARLDEAVAAAYGLPVDASDDAVLQFLLKRNLES